MANNKLQFYIGLLFIWLCINNGMCANYNPYASKQQHLLHDNTDINDATTINMYHNQQNPNPNVAENFAKNLQGYANNQQQLYGYYYIPQLPSYQQESQIQQQSAIRYGYQPTSTQLWSGSPIVVEEIDKQQPSSSLSSSKGVNQVTASTAFYKQKDIPNNINTVILNRNSNKQTATATTAAATQLNYNNNNNIIYHKDFRPQIAVIEQQNDRITWYNRQQQQQQRERQLQFQLQDEHRKQQEQQQQQFYVTNTNFRLNEISNDLRKDNAADYREHFRRYLENNPLRIKPMY